MTISANFTSREEDRLKRSLDLYRDLTIALQMRISALSAGDGMGDESRESKNACEAVKAHQKALQTIIDIEGSLARNNQDKIGEHATILDLGAARVEIAQKLSKWIERGGASGCAG